jgi:hypothetical protein
MMIRKIIPIILVVIFSIWEKPLFKAEKLDAIAYVLTLHFVF